MDETNKKMLKFLKKDGERCILGFEEINEIDYPVVACWRVNYSNVAFWCIDCRKLHFHGWADGTPNGHRCAHCRNPASRYNDTGYVLMCQADLTNPIVLEKYLKEGKGKLPTPGELNDKN